MVFITPLASTAIFPATVFTPCLNCVMSGPEGSTPSKPDVLPERRGVVVLETSCVRAFHHFLFYLSARRRLQTGPPS